VTVYVDIAAAVHGRPGLGRYAGSLARALAAEHRDALAFFYNTDPSVHLLPGLEDIPTRTVEAGYRTWRMQVLIGQLLRQRFDELLPDARLYHATEHLLMPLADVPTVLTVHDLIYRLYPRYHKWKNYAYLNLAMPLFCRRAHAIIAVSEATRRDLIRLYRVPPHKITVIYEAADARFSPPPADTIEAMRVRYGLPERYLMTLCAIEPRKNHAGFLRAFERLCEQDKDLYWVIVGARGWLYEGFLRELERSPARERVILPGYVDDACLPAMYAGALAFVFPSFGEGFGLPPLEAMACGTPVVCSRTTSMPEVCGGAARYIDPHDVDDMAEAVRAVLDDPDLRQAMRAQGLERASGFSWQRAARETWMVYERTIGNGPRSVAQEAPRG